MVFLLIILHLVGCGNVNNKDNADVSLSLFGITFQGESQDEVMTNLIEQTDEFDYFDEERTNIKRKEAKMTQVELAERTQTTKSYISKIEKGIITPSVGMFYRIIAALGMRVEVIKPIY